MEKSVQHRRGLQPNSSTATGDQPQTHRTGTNPHVFQLGVLDALVTVFVLLHLQGATEQHCWLVSDLKGAAGVFEAAQVIFLVSYRMYEVTQLCFTSSTI